MPRPSREPVEKNLTERLERYTGEAVGMERQESRSLVGVSVIRNYFGATTDLNTAIAQNIVLHRNENPVVATVIIPALEQISAAPSIDTE